ncbi:MAG: glutamine synthetase III [Bdellovibrionaceae bacterium]|nr:glutamine synthetase III [Bdellovibrio sp.]
MNDSSSHASTDKRSMAFQAAVNAPIRKIEKVKDAFGKEAPISEYFGCLTFGLGQMREKLPKDAYGNLIKTLEHGKKLPKETAEAIASSVKEWSVTKGVTHFCHWFQPMTGLTAEKHDAFISIQHANHSELRVIERFTGSQLIQGEPDASSFPSGGMRSTFEARGYTAWDPSSPLFIIEEENGKTLCIPTVFFGYHGQALDNKTPLLRSIEAISTEAVQFLKLVGDVDAKKVQTTLGAEQEYFLVDKNFAALRPDLLMTGRTLLGASSARGQQLEDHYFGSIPSRIKSFMQEAEFELYRLGIPIKTRHNEVAPSQFELAPIFEDMNIASDHNLLTMEVLKRVALKHGMVCLLHEKPFAGVNGSGKHNNWSMANDKGENLLEPGHTPHQNLRFLACLAVVLRAVYKNASAMRAAIASPGNDHRLGANEAPPAIISVFLGSLLENILNTIEAGKALKATEEQIIDLGVSQIPNISKDYTDRNRTSPFAFTGNKFEFRAVGSSQNVAVPMSFLNAAVAASFAESSEQLKDLLKKKKRDEAVMELIRLIVKETKAIRFSGNGYSDEWKAEAKKRGLPILNTTPDALEVLKDKKATQFLIDMKVLSKEEIDSRYHIAVERYVKTLDIEHTSLLELTSTYIVPALEKHMEQLGAAHESMSFAALKKSHKVRMAEFEEVFADVLARYEAFKNKVEKSRKGHDENKRMWEIMEDLQPASFKLRDAVDAAELLVADELWPLPKYREMLLAHNLA